MAERRALVLAGPPGAGKTSRREQALAALGEDPAGYVVIDSDVFKGFLIREALRDGSWPQLVPDSVRRREGDGERLYPMEMSALFHSEAAILVMYAQMKWALPAGVNMVLEGVHPNPAAAAGLVKLLAGYDYQVAAASVEASEQECLVRSVSRWAAGYAAAEEGEPGAELGGRWLPSEPIHGLFADGGQESRCSVTVSAITAAARSHGRYFGSVRLTASPHPHEPERTQLRAASERIRDALNATSDH